MSDYMFMLENHLNAEQARLLAVLVERCDALNTNVFLAGGAMRDMLGGFPIRDLDFVVEMNGMKLAKELAPLVNATITSTDDLRKSAELLLPSGASFQIAMCKQEKYLKAGGKAHITPASIHEDLRCRDFTVNSIALSLGKASKGLLMDPTNGLADLERRELRAVHNYVLYDDPVRLWRLIRFKVRLGFGVEERTQQQYANAREAAIEKHITPRALLDQLRYIAKELSPVDVLKALDEEKLLAAISPALTGAKLNVAGFTKLLKIRQFLPFGVDLPVDDFTLLLFLLTEKLTPRERSALFKAIAAEKSETSLVDKMQAKAKKLETALKSAKLQRASQIYQVIAPESGETVLFLGLSTGQRIVSDRIRNYLQKYLPTASEITDKDIEAEGFTPGTPKFAKRKQEKINAKLNERPKKVIVPEPELVTVAATAPGRRIL